MSAKTTKVTKKKTLAKTGTPVARPLLVDVRELILQAREGVARAGRVRQDILKEKRAENGEKIVAALARQLGWTHFTMLLPHLG